MKFEPLVSPVGSFVKEHGRPWEKKMWSILVDEYTDKERTSGLLYLAHFESAYIYARANNASSTEGTITLGHDLIEDTIRRVMKGAVARGMLDPKAQRINFGNIFSPAVEYGMLQHVKSLDWSKSKGAESPFLNKDKEGDWYSREYQLPNNDTLRKRVFYDRASNTLLDFGALRHERQVMNALETEIGLMADARRLKLVDENGTSLADRVHEVNQEVLLSNRTKELFDDRDVSGRQYRSMKRAMENGGLPNNVVATIALLNAEPLAEVIQTIFSPPERDMGKNRWYAFG